MLLMLIELGDRWKRTVQGIMCGVHSCRRIAVSWRTASQS